jgi:5'-nucleotidase
MKRRQFIIQSLAASGAISASPFDMVFDSFSAKDKKLTILHTNDMHSHIDPFENGRYRGLGGMSARATLIETIRSQEEHVLLLDCGDVFQGTPYFNLFGGELELKLMSEMQYDATTIGNHEFDNGLDGLKHAMNYANFPYLSANYDLSKTNLKDSVQPYKSFHKGDMKIGVFGLGIKLKSLVDSRLYGATVYQDPIAVAREMVQELNAQQCDLIICLSHLGYQYDNSYYASDQRLAAEVSEIDLILGGHTHTFMDEPLLITNAEGHTTAINQVGWAGVNLGRIDVTFSRRGKHMNSNGPLDIVG